MKEKTKPQPVQDANSDMETAGVDQAEFQRIKDTYQYPIRLMPKFILDFVKRLQKERPYLYAVILRESDKNFRITRYFNWRLFHAAQKKKVEDRNCLLPKGYSLKKFIASRKTFHVYDQFEMYVYSQRFDHYTLMTLEKVERLYRRFLRGQCEAELRRGGQLQLTPEIIQKYEFSDDDVNIMRKLLNQYNFEARNKIQREYDTLKELPCVRK